MEKVGFEPKVKKRSIADDESDEEDELSRVECGESEAD